MRTSVTALTLSSCFMAYAACSKGGDSRSSSIGTSVFEGKQVTETGTDTGTGPGTGTGSGGSPGLPGGAPGSAGSPGSLPTSTSTGTGTTGTGTSGQASSLTGQSLEQCQTKKQAWEAVVNSGNSPEDCVSALETFCCTRAEVNSRFPTLSSTLESTYFVPFIDQQNLTLYACSVDQPGTPNEKHTLHFAKIVSGTITYKTAFFSGVTQVDTKDPNNNCPVVTTASLNKVSLLLSDGPVPNATPADAPAGAELGSTADSRPVDEEPVE